MPARHDLMGKGYFVTAVLAISKSFCAPENVAQPSGAYGVATWEQRAAVALQGNKLTPIVT